VPKARPIRPTGQKRPVGRRHRSQKAFVIHPRHLIPSRALATR
jgi:hypothetical protein